MPTRIAFPVILTVIIGCGAAGCSNNSPPSTPAAPAAAEPSEPSLDENGSAAMLSIQSEPAGETSDGMPITRYVLSNSHGMQVELIDLGATVTEVLVPDRDGEAVNVTLRHPTAADYEVNAPYFGSIIGRYGNRIAGAKFTLDGQEYTLAENNGTTSLHGGTVGFNKKIWTGEIEQASDHVSVRFQDISPDGEEGYPGTLRTEVVYSLNDANELTIDYSATSDQPTPINLTNHCYWNLAGAGNVLDQVMELNCDAYLPVNESMIPTGEVASVEGTPMDFRSPMTIGSRIEQVEGGYDHCYVINGEAGTLRMTAKVTDPASGRVMEVETTEPAVQFYTGNFLDGSDAVSGFEQHGAFCLEAQHYPDSPNQPEFPNTILKPGETYTQKTVHRFSIAE